MKIIERNSAWLRSQSVTDWTRRAPELDNWQERPANTDIGPLHYTTLHHTTSLPRLTCMTWSCPGIKVHLRIVQQRNSFPVGQSEECSKAPKVIIQKECFVPAIFWPGLGRPGLGRFNYHLENISTTQSQSLIPGSVTRRAEELSALSLLAWKWAETNFVFKCVNCLIRILRQLRQNRTDNFANYPYIIFQ